MGFSDWLEATFAGDKFTAQKGLRHIRKEYQESYTEGNFDTIFLDLAREEMQRWGRLLSIDEVEKLAHRARIQARHYARNQMSTQPINTGYKGEEITEDSKPRTTGKLQSEMYDRLEKQLQSIKTTTELLLSDRELGTVRNMKLKTAQETILKIVKDMEMQAKARGTPTEMQRAYQLEINRWREVASKVHDRLNKNITGTEFKEYIREFDQSFQSTRKTARN